MIDRVRALPTGVVWALGAIPLALLVWDLLAGNMGIDPIRDIEHRLGRTTFYLLMATLMITPLMRLARINVVKFRRALGLLTFSYVAVHLAAWAVLDMGLLWAQVLKDVVKRPYLMFGMGGFVILAILAATSSNAAIRKLGARRWKTLHRLVYLAVPLASLHWLYAYKLWPPKGLAIGALAMLILALRLPVVARAVQSVQKNLSRSGT